MTNSLAKDGTGQAHLQKLRARLDVIDTDLHGLIMQRAETSAEVGAIKAGLTIFRPEREAALLHGRLAAHSGVMPPSAVVALWIELIAGSRMIQGMGPIGLVAERKSLSLQLLAMRHLGSTVPIILWKDVPDLLAALEKGEISLGVIGPQTLPLLALWRQGKSRKRKDRVPVYRITHAL